MQAIYNLILEAYTSKKKHSIIFNCESSINSCGAWITDFKFLSDKMIHFVLESEYENLLNLIEDLRKKDIIFYDYSTEQIQLIKSGKKKGELLVSLSIHFVSGEKGDMGTKIS